MIECVGSSRGMLIAWVGVGDCTFIDLGSLKFEVHAFYKSTHANSSVCITCSIEYFA
jgi:hypothetical protein